MTHEHVQKKVDYNRAFAIGVLLNVLFVAVEAGFGLAADSMALIADAGHNLSDVFSLLLAWGASFLAGRPATEKKTYGFRKLTIMASLTSSIMLLIALGGIIWEALGRLFVPQPVVGRTVIIVAAIGVLINTVTAMLFFSGQKDDLNIKAAYLHMAADAGVSLGVVVAGLLIVLTGWLRIDPLTSIVIAVIILIGTWSLLRESLDMAIDSVPKNIDLAGIKSYLLGLDNVHHFHDLHVWPLSTTETALSVHLVMATSCQDRDFLTNIQQTLHERFLIGHSTIQVEQADDAYCPLDGSR